mmetsp:Transcript_88025/g.204832  ORF Transcript_88025/g.204832 Transcript_88025/m.204832 type:complete len:378 (+) Transcript_88025:142-1275(+)
MVPRFSALEGTEEENEALLEKPEETLPRGVTLAEELLSKDKYDWIVSGHSFREYPRALCCARLTQVFLLLVVFISLIVLLVYYCLGVVQIEREYYWYDTIRVPTLVICPDWAGQSRGFQNFSLGNISFGTFPSPGIVRGVNHTCVDCMESRGLPCKCIDFDNEWFEEHEHSTDLMQVSFVAQQQSQAFVFGFNEPSKNNSQEVPQTFGYGLLGTRALGYLTHHLIDLREKKIGTVFRGGFSKFRDLRLYDWEIAGNAVPTEIENVTELLFGFKTFQVARDQTFVALWSPFAIFTVIAMAMSLVNNLNIFGLVWPVQQHPVFTQREPACLLRVLCGCCGCMRRKRATRHHLTRLEQLLAEHQEELKTELKTPRVRSPA